MSGQILSLEGEKVRNGIWIGVGHGVGTNVWTDVVTGFRYGVGTKTGKVSTVVWDGLTMYGLMLELVSVWVLELA